MTDSAWNQPQKLLWAAAGSAVIGIVLLVFFAFGQWIDGTPGYTSYSTRGVQSSFDSTQTITVSDNQYNPGSFYYYWVSIDTPIYTLPIGGAAALLGIAGWMAASAARRPDPDPARLKRATKIALTAVGMGLAGGAIFEAALWWLDPIDWWLDAGFYGLVSAGTTAAALLWRAARAQSALAP
jgi:hypothetical protein